MKKYIFVAALALVISGCALNKPSVSTKSTVKTDEVAASSSADKFESLESKIERINQTVEKIYFAFDKYNISMPMQEVVRTNADLFNTEVPNTKILVEGNCDEWGTDEYNQALGLRRAKAGKEALVARGVAADRISIKSYGETNPVCTERTRACDARNRRDDFKISQ